VEVLERIPNFAGSAVALAVRSAENAEDVAVPDVTIVLLFSSRPQIHKDWDPSHLQELQSNSVLLPMSKL
jgi:hypothetical protein